MAKRNDDRDIEVLTENWISIGRKEDPVAWNAWRDWRRAQLGAQIEPDAFTVPTPFPPATIAAAREYIAIVQQIRASNGWKGQSAKLKTDVSAWMGQ